MPDIAWLAPATVAAQPRPQRGQRPTGTPGRPRRACTATASSSTRVGDVTLQPGRRRRQPRPAAGQPDASRVKFANQGDNDETNVKVTVTRHAAAARPITVDARRSARRRPARRPTVDIPLGADAADRHADHASTVAIAQVPGEKKTDNNRQSYTVIFTR